MRRASRLGSNDQSCPLWLLSTGGSLTADNRGESWNYRIDGGFGNLVTAQWSYRDDSCAGANMAFEWEGVDRSFKDLSDTIGPNLEDLTALDISFNGAIDYNPGNCGGEASFGVEVTVQYPNLHEDTVAVLLFEANPSAEPIVATNYLADLSGANLYTGKMSGSTEVPFRAWENHKATHTTLDLMPLLLDRLYVPPPIAAYNLKDAQIHRIRLFSRSVGGTMHVTLSNLTVTGN
jgi:hypothetical protein